VTLDENNSPLFKQALDVAVDGIAIAETNGKMIYVNNALLKMYGETNMTEMVERNVLEFIAQTDRSKVAALCLSNLRKQEVSREKFIAVTKNGREFPIELTVTPLKNKEETTVGFITIFRNINEQVKNEHNLATAQRKLELANEKLLVVGGFVRHDIANRVSMLNMIAYLAKKNGNLEGLLDAMNVTNKQITRTLEFSRDYEMLGKEQLSYIKVASIFDEVTNMFPNCKLQFINHCGNLCLFADSMLKELLYNLIENSIKYGKTATKIQLSYLQTEEGLKLIYKDDGVGISAEDKLKLFTKGYGKGTGLGLYLIKKTLDVYGWQIKETGIPSKNAQFEITVPKNNYRLK
jgi:PAS domain S-box-containing protein